MQIGTIERQDCRSVQTRTLAQEVRIPPPYFPTPPPRTFLLKVPGNIAGLIPAVHKITTQPIAVVATLYPERAAMTRNYTKIISGRVHKWTDELISEQHGSRTFNEHYLNQLPGYAKKWLLNGAGVQLSTQYWDVPFPIQQGDGR